MKQERREEKGMEENSAIAVTEDWVAMKRGSTDRDSIWPRAAGEDEVF